MIQLVKCIEELRTQLSKHRKAGLKEYPTRTIFIDPMLKALGWDVRDPDDVQLECPTIDGKAVDYAMKVNRKIVLYVEAKQLGNPLEELKALTQVVGYAANNGVEWCVLTNGVRYKVYKASEKASAPEKILFEVSIDPNDSKGTPVHELAKQFSRLSKESMASGLLDQLGTEVFTNGKVRKALENLILEEHDSLIRLIRKKMSDKTVRPSQVAQALRRIWDTSAAPALEIPQPIQLQTPVDGKKKTSGDYPENHHTGGKPNEVIELYRGLDRFCKNMLAGRITRTFKAKYVSWSLDKAIFCTAHLQMGGLRVWVKVNPSTLDPSVSCARDVSKIGHWGVGQVELAVNSIDRLRDAEPFIQKSFENTTRK